MQKAFSSSRSCAFALRVGEKHFLCQRNCRKKKAVNFGCRKRFLRPEAVLLHCEWAKKRFLRRKELLFSLSLILLLYTL